MAETNETKSNKYQRPVNLLIKIPKQKKPNDKKKEHIII